MKSVRVLFLTAILVVTCAAIASAQTSTPRIDRRETRQHERIQQGVRSGELTHGEARNLRAGQRHIHRMEMRAKSDGKVTPRERARITRAQDRQSRKIWREKHNDNVR
jgi:hypothetical protein